MKSKRQFAQILCLSLVAGISIPAWADSSDATTPDNSAADVTMTVIPHGDDVSNTVTQNIEVPEHDNEDAGLANKPGAAPATGSKADNGEAFGRDTADAAKEMEDSKEAAQAAQDNAEEEKQTAEDQMQQAQESEKDSQATEVEQPDTSSTDSSNTP